jgi:F-type H+-transporting ATPase subunit delta
MIDAVVGARYARAIFEIAEEKNVIENLYKELDLVMEVYEGDEEFKNFIDHPLVKKSEKKALVSKLFTDKFEASTVELLEYLVDKGRLSFIRSIVAEYLKLYYAKNSIVEAEATFATEPSDVQIKSLKEKLESRTSKKVKLSTAVDKSILGGVVIRIGDEIIDASVKKELEAFRNNY